MKIEIDVLSNDGKLFLARCWVVDSIIEFIDDPNTTGKLLYALSSGTGDGPIKILQPSAVQQLDPGTKNNQLWVHCLGLPYHGPHRQFHGIFVKNKEIIRGVKDEGCWLHIYGEKLGYDLEFPLCEPYVLVYGRKRFQVLNAVDHLRRAMQAHQENCQCASLW
jgi:hypothetical protein